MRCSASLWLTMLSLSLASHALAQPPPAQPPQQQPQPPPPRPAPAPPAEAPPPQPQPTQAPPPEAPPANWAPPLPEQAPPPEPAGAPATAAAPAAGMPAEGTPAEGTPAAAPPSEAANPTEPEESALEVYGFAMFDGGYDFGKIGDPAWEDVVRPTKLPAFDNEFGKGGRTFEAVKQSRFGIKGTTPTSAGDITTKFEFELFGTGVDAGQTTFRLRHFYGEWRHLLAGQTWSPFMDPDVFPNSIEYWGPNGMVFFRTIHIEYKPWVHDKSYATIAAERPGASADQGNYADRVELESVVPRFPAPDLSGNVHIAGPWGHVQLAGILRYIKWDDVGMAPTVVEGHAWGWGVNLSANIKLAPALLKLQAVYGQAIQNYMNDAGADIGPVASTNPARPIEGEALRMLGIVAFVDLDWSKYATSSVGYSYVWIDNSSEQAPDAFHVGHYALGNILLHPSKDLMFGPEFQFGRRQNNSDGFSANDYRVQFSIKYSFGQKIGGAR